VVGRDREELMSEFIEFNKGKSRVMPLRPSDVQPSEPRTDRERLEGREADGTASAGNKIAVGRGWKSAIRKAVEGAARAIDAPCVGDADMQKISDEAAVVYMGILASAPVSPPLMRINAGGVAREFAIAAFLDVKAAEAGLLTEDGERLANRASYHRQRCERLSITTHALSQRPKCKRASANPALKSHRNEVVKSQ
jgi:hypothetical protein